MALYRSDSDPVALRYAKPIVGSANRHTHRLVYSFIGSVTVLSLVDLLKLLLLEVGGLGELKSDVMSGEVEVGGSHGVKLVLNEVSVKRVKVDGLDWAAASGDTSSTANNAGWHDDVVENGLVDSLEGAASWALLAGVADLSLGVNGSVDNNDDGPLELSLQMINHLVADLLVELERSVGDLDLDVLLSGAIIALVLDLLYGVEVHHAQVLLDILVGVLESGEGLRGILLHLSWLDLIVVKRQVNKHCLAKLRYLRLPSSEAWSC